MSDEPRINDAGLAVLKQAYEASTRGNWRRGHKQLPDLAETKEWLARMVEFNAAQPNLELLCAMVDASDPPEVLENIEEYYCPAITGNGPNSEANALFIELAHNNFQALLNMAAACNRAISEAERWRAERNAMGLHAHEMQHLADAEHRRAALLAQRVRQLLIDARELIIVTADIMRASETLPAAAAEQLAKAEKSANELGALLDAQPDQIGPPLDGPV